MFKEKWRPQSPPFLFRAMVLAFAAFGAAIFAYLSIRPARPLDFMKPAPTPTIEWPEGFVELTDSAELPAMFPGPPADSGRPAESSAAAPSNAPEPKAHVSAEPPR